jgi:hypothetical protein
MSARATELIAKTIEANTPTNRSSNMGDSSAFQSLQTEETNSFLPMKQPLQSIHFANCRNINASFSTTPPLFLGKFAASF